jgi:ribonuclease HI/nucleotide-binding universal stress UspA family protein
MDRCLVAYDGQPASEAALSFAARYAEIAEAHLDVLHVADDSAAGHAVLARTSAAFSASPFSYETHLANGKVEEAVSAAIAEYRSNALFTGTSREEGRRLVPSHTEAILRATDLPRPRPQLNRTIPVPAPRLPIAVLHLDESCLGNGRDGANPGGAGGLIEVRTSSGIQRRDFYISAPDTTNNKMALCGAIAALQLLGGKGKRLRALVVSDSEYLVKGVREWAPGWKTRGWTRKGGTIENLELCSFWWNQRKATMLNGPGCEVIAVIRRTSMPTTSP